MRYGQEAGGAGGVAGGGGGGCWVCWGWGRWLGCDQRAAEQQHQQQRRWQRTRGAALAACGTAVLLCLGPLMAVLGKPQCVASMGSCPVAVIVHAVGCGDAEEVSRTGLPERLPHSDALLAKGCCMCPLSPHCHYTSFNAMSRICYTYSARGPCVLWAVVPSCMKWNCSQRQTVRGNRLRSRVHAVMIV